MERANPALSVSLEENRPRNGRHSSSRRPITILLFSPDPQGIHRHWGRRAENRERYLRPAAPGGRELPREAISGTDLSSESGVPARVFRRRRSVGVGRDSFRSADRTSSRRSWHHQHRGESENPGAKAKRSTGRIAGSLSAKIQNIH